MVAGKRVLRNDLGNISKFSTPPPAPLYIHKKYLLSSFSKLPAQYLLPSLMSSSIEEMQYFFTIIRVITISLMTVIGVNFGAEQLLI